jgi:hypothetical protein
MKQEKLTMPHLNIDKLGHVLWNGGSIWYQHYTLSNLPSIMHKSHALEHQDGDTSHPCVLKNQFVEPGH